MISHRTTGLDAYVAGSPWHDRFRWMLVEYKVEDTLIAHTDPISPPVVRPVRNEGIPAGRPCGEGWCGRPLSGVSFAVWGNASMGGGVGGYGFVRARGRYHRASSTT